ncbi:MAG: 1-acyl-sn-glycerol-3-phosphate acyltransferase [Planctomycetes bacterium]|nr:1-acyl-sn-glycerol-3-phosphate acyltransferase [Planctomycetota bacterium]
MPGTLDSSETKNHSSARALQPIGFMNRILFRLQVCGIGAFLKIAFRLKVTGETVPPDGPLIVAANHESLLDPIVLQIAIRRRLQFLMTSDYYFKPLLNRYVRMMRCIPVMEEQLNREALRTALKVLAAGRPVGIFPQGGLRKAGDFSTDLRGIGLLADKSRSRILPVRLMGTGRAWPRGARFFHPSRIEVRIGKPFHPEVIADRDAVDRRSFLHRITLEVMRAVEKL